MYLFACRIKIKMKQTFLLSTMRSCNMLIQQCVEKNLSQSSCTDCKIITIKNEEKDYWVGCSDVCQCFEIQ
jgi:hypothetical protein